MAKTVWISPRAQKEFRELQTSTQERIRSALKELAAGKRMDVKKLAELENLKEAICSGKFGRRLREEGANLKEDPFRDAAPLRLAFGEERHQIDIRANACHRYCGIRVHAPRP